MRKYTLTLAPIEKLDFDYCHADTCEISRNGTLTFYNITNGRLEFIKSYAHRYWLECTDKGEIKK